MALSSDSPNRPDEAMAVPEALTRVPELDLAVCHGDACNPNFLFTDPATFVGCVDLGLSGVADRWADLAPAIMSLGWNFGESEAVHTRHRDPVSRRLRDRARPGQTRLVLRPVEFRVMGNAE